MTLSEGLKSHGVSSLWNVTHLDNLKSVLEHGILCHDDALLRNLAHTDISNRQVQNRRPAEFRGCVPLFFADNTPMLYVTAHDRSVILLAVSLEVADKDGVRFSNRNVATSEHTVSSCTANLDALNWGIILDRRGAWSREWKAVRSAEVLVPTECDSSFIECVHVQQAEDEGITVAERARQIIRDARAREIPVRDDLTAEGIRA
jgi:hypothetical protein